MCHTPVACGTPRLPKIEIAPKHHHRPALHDPMCRASGNPLTPSPVYSVGAGCVQPERSCNPAFCVVFARMAGIALVAVWPRPAVLADEMVFVPAPGRFVAFDANLDFRFGQTLPPSHVRSAMVRGPLPPVCTQCRSDRLVCSALNNTLNIPTVE